MKVKVFIFSKSYDGFCLYLVGRSQDFIEHYPQPYSQPRSQGHHHHHRIFDQRAGTGATATSVGPLPGSWLAARLSDLSPDLQVCLSWRLIAESFHSLQSLSVSCFHVILGLPGPGFPSICMSKAVLTATLENSTCPYQWSLLSFRTRSRSSMPSCASSSMDLMVTMPCGLTLQICLIIALLRCRCWRCGFFNGQVSLVWSIAHRTQELYKQPRVLRGGGKRELVAAPWTSSRRFSHVVVESSQPGAAEYICNQGPLSSALAHCISCTPSAYCHCRRGCCCPLQCCMETRLNSAGGPGLYHISWSFLHLLYPFSSIASFQEPPDTFLEQFSNDNKVICIEVLTDDPRAELVWQGFKHSDEVQWAE